MNKIVGKGIVIIEHQDLHFCQIYIIKFQKPWQLLLSGPPVYYSPH
jgi:hypothetical protein